MGGSEDEHIFILPLGHIRTALCLAGHYCMNPSCMFTSLHVFLHTQGNRRSATTMMTRECQRLEREPGRNDRVGKREKREGKG